MQNVLAKHEIFEEAGGGETSKQGQEVLVVSCQPNNVGQFRQALRLQLHGAIYRPRFYPNSLIHTLSLSNSHNNVASLQ